VTTEHSTAAFSRAPVCILAGVAALTALTFAIAMPTTTSATVERGGVVTSLGTNVHWLTLVFVVLQEVAALAAFTGIILVLSGRPQPARRALMVASMTGLVPVVVPGVLALLATYLLGKAATQWATH